MADCVRLAETVPEQYRTAAFRELLRHSLMANSGLQKGANAAIAGEASAASELNVEVLAKILTSAPGYDLRILAAVRILELESAEIPQLVQVPFVFRRYRVKAPANLSRDAGKLIRRGLLLEHGRAGGRVQLGIGVQGLSELEQYGRP